MKRREARSQESIDFAKTQRRTTNELAATVWQWLRNRQCCGQKFRREFPIPPYTVDFCCVELGLVIEIDGEAHFTASRMEHDRSRDEFLEQNGYQVLRIKGYEVIRDGRNVVERMEKFVRDALQQDSTRSPHRPSPPAPLPAAGRGEPDK